MMLLDEQVAEGIAPPRLYGLAYRDHLHSVGHFYPIPLNYLVQWGRSFWFWLKRGPGPNALDQAKAQARREVWYSPEVRHARQVELHIQVWRNHIAAQSPDLVRDMLLEKLNAILEEPQ